MSYQLATLRRPEGAGYREEQAYIPSEHAVAGKTVRIKREEWEEGWVVHSVSPEKISRERANGLHDRQRIFREQEVAGRRSYKEKRKG